MAEGARFLYQFALANYDSSNPGSNIISVTSTATGDFSKTNLTTNSLREKWRSSGVAVQRIVIQASDTDNAIDTFAILNHNFSSTAVITLEGNTSDSWGVPAVSVTIPWAKKHIVLMQAMASAYEYWRLSVLDPANACGFVEIGRIVGGSSLIMTGDEDITDDFSVSTDDLAYKTRTEGFHRASNEKVKVDKLTVRFDKLVSDDGNDNYTRLWTMIDYVGETIPFLSVIDPDDADFFVIWGQIDTMPSRAFGINRYVSLPMVIQEVY